jgi:sucrose phosphorylase
VERKEGRISWKTDPDGSQSPYELNINYLSALSEPGESQNSQIARFSAAHAILFMLQGVPAIYYHSLLGSENDVAGLRASGINRRINRESWIFHACTVSLSTHRACVPASMAN